MNRISDITKKINFPEGMEIYKINKNLKINFKNEEDFWEKVVDLIIKKSNDPEGVVLPDIDNLAKQNHFGKYSLCPPDPRMKFDGNILVNVVVNRLKKYQYNSLTNEDQKEIEVIFDQVGNILSPHFGSYNFFSIIDIHGRPSEKKGIYGEMCSLGLNIFPEKKDEIICFSSGGNEFSPFGEHYFQTIHLLVLKERYGLTAEDKLTSVDIDNLPSTKPPVVITKEALDNACKDIRILAQHGFEVWHDNSGSPCIVFDVTKDGNIYEPRSFICHNPKFLQNNNDSINENYEDEFWKNRNNKEFLDKYINKIKEKIKNCKNIIIK